MNIDKDVELYLIYAFTEAHIYWSLSYNCLKLPLFSNHLEQETQSMAFI